MEVWRRDMTAVFLSNSQTSITMKEKENTKRSGVKQRKSGTEQKGGAK